MAHVNGNGRRGPSARTAGPAFVVVLGERSTVRHLKSVNQRLEGWVCRVEQVMNGGRPVLQVTAPSENFDARLMEALEGVQEVMRLTDPFRLVSRAFHPADTTVRVGSVAVGGRGVVMMAGPCAVESESQLDRIAGAIRMNGVRVLRGGAFKPRTSPYTFQGMGVEGYRILRRVADRHGLAVVSEVTEVSRVPLAAEYVDLLQVGARNMQNFDLLKALGSVRKPVLLKRGMAATIEEWLMSAEYVMAGGNPEVILCERGIRTFEPSTRNTLDLAAIPIIQRISHLPIIVDPSHGTGRRDAILPLARAAVAAGAQGLLVEVHHDPDQALSDGAQSITPAELRSMMAECTRLARAIGRRWGSAKSPS